MIRAVLAAALLVASAAASAASTRCDLEYRFVPRWDTPDDWVFDVTLSFAAGDRTTTRVRLVSEWGGVYDFHRGIRDVAAPASRHDVEPTKEPNVWVVRHPPGGRVNVRYSLVNDVPNVDQGAIQHREFYRNMLGRTHFHFFGHGTLLRPEHFAEFEPLAACLDFQALPGAWTFASSHGQGSKQLRIEVTPVALRSAVFVGGDFRIHSREVAGRPIFVALRGAWTFEDAKYVDAVATVVSAHRTFWSDHAFPYYLMTLLPNRVERGSTGGTGLHKSFAMHASNEFSVPGASFDQIVAHEHLHSWIPRRIGTMGRPEARRYWFSEGFTNYLTRHLQLRAGMTGLEDYARDMNRAFSEYWLSSARDLDNAQVADRFWSDNAAQRIPYLRGEFVALLWSKRLRGQPGGLEGVLKSLRLEADAFSSEPDERAPDLAVNRLAAALRAKLGDVVDADLAAHIEAGRPVEVGEDFLGPCFVGTRVPKPRFEVGFDMATSLGPRRLKGVVPGSNAEKAGLRDGMQLGGWSIYGDGMREVEIDVIEDGRRRTVRYLPASAEPVQVPQFRVKDGAHGDAACRAWRTPT